MEFKGRPGRRGKKEAYGRSSTTKSGRRNQRKKKRRDEKIWESSVGNLDRTGRHRRRLAEKSEKRGARR